MWDTLCKDSAVPYKELILVPIKSKEILPLTSVAAELSPNTAAAIVKLALLRVFY